VQHCTLCSTAWPARDRQETRHSPARATYLTELATVPLLIIDDLGMRKLAHTAAGSPRADHATVRTRFNTPHVKSPGGRLGQAARRAAVTALLAAAPRTLLKCGPRSWRTKVQTDLRTEEK